MPSLLALARVTITAALGLIIAFAAADLLLFNALRVSLTNSVDDYARSGASQVAALINADRLPDPVPVAAGTITIQVLDSAGHITDAANARNSAGTGYCPTIACTGSPGVNCSITKTSNTTATIRGTACAMRSAAKRTNGQFRLKKVSAFL